MKVIILCGGRGERMGELTDERPKPMVEIGGQPILWHIMRHFAEHQFTQFILALGYHGWMIQDYFQDPGSHPAGWTVQLVPTGWKTQNGGRLKRLAPYLGGETFLMVWCDGVSNLDLTAMLAFHQSHGRLCTVATVQPPERFGSLEIAWSNAPGYNYGRVTEFYEKVRSSRWINAGFFACEPGVLDYIGDDDQWERGPMERLAKDGELMAFAQHEIFWQCMDTAKDRRLLEELWASGRAPWKTWT